jgi:hypothetical protein
VIDQQTGTVRWKQVEKAAGTVEDDRTRALAKGFGEDRGRPGFVVLAVVSD